ncbi:serine/threonine-protein kinase S6KL-like isoform X3 [Artemia franciscana]|uniref:serine/threonine-protein kinase S6KL-like isoform X3 n=1 Tax=Artemia franciscana TaxID=6661 RepID=UPI0032D9DD0E
MGNIIKKTKEFQGDNPEYKSTDFGSLPLGTTSFRSWAGSERTGFSISSIDSRRSRYLRSLSAGAPRNTGDTRWPIAYFEAIFLGEFKLRNGHYKESYSTVRELSSGSFGKVYLTKSLESGQLFAAKILSKAQIICERAVQQTKDEVSIQLMCGHNPFIILCFEYWQERRNIIIVSELAERGDLLKLWQVHGKMEEDLVKIYLVQIASAVDFLHNAGVIYRDLKLENIVLKQDGSAKIVDFGLSKWLKLGDRTNTICGTLFYMAPEVLKGEPYSHAVDYWSLGVVVFALLTGKFS